jgi:hypothetical protein
MANEVLPACNLFERHSNRKIKRVLVGTDAHGKSIDPFAFDVFEDSAKRLQPDLQVLGGDWWDLYEFSRYTVDPRRVDVVGEFRCVKEKLRRLREAAPKSQIDLILGNHEWRILKYLAEKSPMILPLLSDVMGLTLADIFGVKQYEINLICKWDLAAWNVRDEKSQVAANHATYWNNAWAFRHIPPAPGKSYTISGASGHTHKPDLTAFANSHGRNTWMVCPSLAYAHADDYVEGANHYYTGFGIAYVDTETKQVQQSPIVVNDFAVVEGKYYERT